MARAVLPHCENRASGVIFRESFVFSAFIFPA
jgi:hypothetical protein